MTLNMFGRRRGWLPVLDRASAAQLSPADSPAAIA
jgi:hypothetical protein